MSGLIDSTSAYSGLLSPEDKQVLENNLWTNLGLGLLARSGPSRIPQNAFSNLGSAGLEAVQNSQQMVPQLLNSKMLSYKIANQQRLMPIQQMLTDEIIRKYGQQQTQDQTQQQSQGDGTPPSTDGLIPSGNGYSSTASPQSSGLIPRPSGPGMSGNGLLGGTIDPMFALGALSDDPGLTKLGTELQKQRDPINAGGGLYFRGPNNTVTLAPGVSQGTQDIEAAKAQGKFPYEVLQNIAHGAGRNVVVSPGQTAVSGVSLLPSGFLNMVPGMGGQPQPGMPQTGTPSPGMPISSLRTPSASGVPNTPMAGSIPTALGQAPVVQGMSPFVDTSQKDYASNLEKQYSGWQDQADKAKGDNLILSRMQQEVNSWEPNKLASNWGAVKEYTNALDPNHKVFSEQLGDYQAFKKNAVQISTSAARNMGAREPGSVIQMFRTAYPNEDMTRNGLNAIITQFKGMNNYKQAQQQAADQWRTDPRNSGTLAGFQSSWNKNVDPMYFVYQEMPQPVQQKFISNMSTKDYTTFKNGYSTAIKMGYLQ